MDWCHLTCERGNSNWKETLHHTPQGLLAQRDTFPLTCLSGLVAFVMKNPHLVKYHYPKRATHAIEATSPVVATTWWINDSRRNQHACWDASPSSWAISLALSGGIPPHLCRPSETIHTFPLWAVDTHRLFTSLHLCPLDTAVAMGCQICTLRAFLKSFHSDIT